MVEGESVEIDRVERAITRDPIQIRGKVCLERRLSRIGEDVGVRIKSFRHRALAPVHAEAINAACAGGGIADIEAFPVRPVFADSDGGVAAERAVANVRGNDA